MTSPAVVFGGTGFLGRAVVDQLVEGGWPVRVAARHPGTPTRHDTVESWTVDVRDEAAVAAVVKDAGAVVNAVSLYVETGELDFESIHVQGAERVARLAAAAGVERLVHISGIGVDSDSISPYVAARARGEDAVRAAFHDATILRPSVIFGPGDAFVSTLDTVTRLPVIPLFGDGGTRLQPVHVEDVARAVAASLTRPEAGGQVFELGGAEVLRYRDVLRAVLRHRGRHRALLPVPFTAWRGIACLGSLLPRPPVTRDQLVLMATDNVVGGDVKTFADLGIEPRGFVEALGDSGKS